MIFVLISFLRRHQWECGNLNHITAHYLTVYSIPLLQKCYNSLCRETQVTGCKCGVFLFIYANPACKNTSGRINQLCRAHKLYVAQTKTTTKKHWYFLIQPFISVIQKRKKKWIKMQHEISATSTLIALLIARWILVHAVMFLCVNVCTDQNADITNLKIFFCCRAAFFLNPCSASSASKTQRNIVIHQLPIQAVLFSYQLLKINHKSVSNNS